MTETLIRLLRLMISGIIFETAAEDSGESKNASFATNSSKRRPRREQGNYGMSLKEGGKSSGILLFKGYADFWLHWQTLFRENWKNSRRLE
jgi:hypothetical protein